MSTIELRGDQYCLSPFWRQTNIEITIDPCTLLSAVLHATITPRCAPYHVAYPCCHSLLACFPLRVVHIKVANWMIAAIRRAFIGAEKGFVRGRDILGACKMSWVETNTILMQEWKEKGREGSRVGSREGSKVGEGSIALPATSPCNIAQLIRLSLSRDYNQYPPLGYLLWR